MKKEWKVGERKEKNLGKERKSMNHERVYMRVYA